MALNFFRWAEASGDSPTCSQESRSVHLLYPSPGETILAAVANHVHHLLQVIHPASNMISLARAVPKAGYGTSAIEYVLPTMGR